MTIDHQLVSLVLIAYNQEHYVREAVIGALSQTYSPLEIILSDDSSTDRTFEVMAEVIQGYSGGHRLRLRRTDANVGLCGHLNQIMAETSGQLIVVAAGDDVSLPHRVQSLAAAYASSHQQAWSLYSNCSVVGPDGTVERLFYPRPPTIQSHELSSAVTSGFSLLGATHAWDARIFTIFGDLPETVRWEDWVIPFRAALLGRIQYVDEVLVLYRRHAANEALGQDGHLASKDAWTRNIVRRSEEELLVLESHLKDIETSRRAALQEDARLTAISDLVLATVAQVEDRRVVLGGCGLRRKVVATQRLLSSSQLCWRKRVKWLLAFWAPSLYVRRLQKTHRP